MQTELLDQWATVSRKALESMKELGQINERILARMTEQQQQILSACLEATSLELQMMGGAKDPKDLLAKQAELVSQYSSKFVDIVRSTNDLLADCRSELSAWLEKGVAAANAPPKAAKTK
ncbi:MAG: phasin family protein [Gammaproteobacteria bacterium]